MRRPFIASISGKGGTGKTTLTALLLKVLIDNSIEDTILVVDADPATNLPEVLGVNINKTIGDIVEEFRKKNNNISDLGFEKSSLLQYWILRDSLTETPHFDLIAMGRGEGEGCYCYVNSILTRILVELMKNYSVVLMDMEAGLEHLSRRVDRYVNTLIVVVDPSIMSIKTAERIITIAREVNIKPEKLFLVGNRMSENMVNEVVRYAHQLGYEYAGTIPNDDTIYMYNLGGKSLLIIPQNTKAIQATRIIAKNIGLID
uniref:ATP-binding protein n=1 Tax=Ignisphaera aggregans TaxID=334771 RepID=A0A832CWG6_9CREN